MNNYSKICIEILGKAHELTVFTDTEKFVFNDDGDYFEDDELEKMTIPSEEIVVINSLINSGFLKSDEFRAEVIAYINVEKV